MNRTQSLDSWISRLFHQGMFWVFLGAGIFLLSWLLRSPLLPSQNGEQSAIFSIPNVESTLVYLQTSETGTALVEGPVSEHTAITNRADTPHTFAQLDVSSPMCGSRGL